MKKTILIVLIISVIITSFNAKAYNQQCSYNNNTQISVLYPDGRQCFLQANHITVLANGAKLIESFTYKAITRSTVNRDKTYFYVNNNNVVQWEVTLTATFTYNGYTSSCTSASSYSRVYEGNWSERDNNTFASGNAAVANVTMVRKILFIVVETQVANLVITCDKDGNTQ